MAFLLEHLLDDRRIAGCSHRAVFDRVGQFLDGARVVRDSVGSALTVSCSELLWVISDMLTSSLARFCSAVLGEGTVDTGMAWVAQTADDGPGPRT
jgi:hypothetical protein